MANEIQITARLEVSKGFTYAAQLPAPILANLTGTAITSGVQAIGTSAEALLMNDVTTAGYAYFRNTDATNFVEIGTGISTSFVSFAKLKAGEIAVIRLGTNAPTAKADTAAINLQYMILAD
jgi:hypothetical protein